MRQSESGFDAGYRNFGRLALTAIPLVLGMAATIQDAIAKAEGF